MVVILKKSKIDSKYKNCGKLDDNYIITFKMLYKTIPTGYQLTKMGIALKEFNLEQIVINNFYASVRGRAIDISRLFSTEIDSFAYCCKKYFSEVKDIIIPNEIDFVSDVIGLNDFPVFVHHTIINKFPDVQGYSPVTIGNLYDFPLYYTGANRVIAMIELGGGYCQKDLECYFLKCLNLGVMPTVIPLPFGGAKNDPCSPCAPGVVMDIEIAGAIAKCSTIVVYFAPNNALGFYDAIYFATTNYNYRPCAMCISWGAPEDCFRDSYLESVNRVFKIARNNYTNVMVSSGDEGSRDGTGKLVVDFPACCTNVVGCGGSTIFVQDDVIVNEITWSGSGGGYSNYFLKPDYQDIEGEKRGVPDTAGYSDPDIGYFIYFGGKKRSGGGTGACAALYSGLVALCSEAKGSIDYLNLYLYPEAEKICYDIVKGSNGPDGKYDATVGWDPCTGNGRIYGIKLLENT